MPRVRITATMRRHDLIRVQPRCWGVMLERRPELRNLPLVEDWALKGWPVIVRRRTHADAADITPAALPLPPCFDKRRISFSLPAGTAIEPMPPVLLEDASAAAISTWQAAIAALLALGRDADTQPRVYGSLLWQHLTGLPYLTATSDLDLLWHVENAATATALITALSRIEASAGVRIDGELQLPNEAEVSWREFASSVAYGQDCVLVKTMQAVTLRSVANLFEPRPCST